MLSILADNQRLDNNHIPNIESWTERHPHYLSDLIEYQLNRQQQRGGTKKECGKRKMKNVKTRKNKRRRNKKNKTSKR
jgi:hypothetical protein